MSLGQNIIFEPRKNQKAVPVTQLNPFPVQISGGSASPFGEVITATRTPIVELNSAYGPSLIRDIQETSNTASISGASSGEILMSTGATASSTATLFSGERGRYVPGYAAQGGVGIRIPTLPTGNQEAKWGIIDPAMENGFYFGVDADGVYTAVIRDGSISEQVWQSDFNIDPADGTGDSGITLDLSDGNIFQIDFTWYGYGQILFGVLQVVGSFQRFVPLHQFRPTAETSIVTPNLPVTVEVTNGADAADFDVYVGGRQYSIIGDYIPKVRFAGQERTGVTVNNGTVTPLVSFRDKTGFEDRSLKIAATSANVATADAVLEIYLNPTLTGASWVTPTNHTAAEVAVETDVSATAISGGTLIWSDYVTQGESNKPALSKELQDFDVPENQIITLAARGVGGDSDIDAFFRVQEEW